MSVGLTNRNTRQTVGVTALQAAAFADRIETLAKDVGRLRRRLPEDDFNAHLVDRISMSIDDLDTFLQPTAGELCRDGMTVEAALATVDARTRHLSSLLQEPPR